MSRLANKIRAGFFPTPPELFDTIASHLAPPGEHVRWSAVDPCAGEGIALSKIAFQVGGDPDTFGIELDANRAREAIKRLSLVLSASYENVRASRDSFGLLWLNPPYDHDATQPGKRLEYAFLKCTTEWLAPGGVLVYIIPDSRISRNIATLLASRYERIEVRRFPAKHYAAFKQAVIFAVRRKTQVVNDTETGRLLSLADGTAPELEEGAHEYKIPQHHDSAHFAFHVIEAAAAELEAEAKAAGAWTLPDFREAMNPPTARELRPLLPLRRGHVAMLIAAGALNNTHLERGDRRILVKGNLEKNPENRSTAEEQAGGIERTVDRFTAVLTTLDLESGDVAEIKDETALRAWFTEWRESVMTRLAEQARPLHAGDLAPVAPTLAALGRKRRLPGRRASGLFEAQKHVAAAIAKLLASRNRVGVIQAEMGTGKTTMGIAVAELLRQKIGFNRSRR